MSWADRRGRLRQLGKISELILDKGISPYPELIELAAVAALIDKELDSEPLIGRSTRVVKLLHNLHDITIERGPAFDFLACKRGCSLCCDLYVSASPPDIFAIADSIRARTSKSRLAQTIDQIESANSPAQGLSAAERADTRIMCAFLKDNLCTIYQVRPVACRSWCSTSLSTCEAGARGESVDIPQPEYVPLTRFGYDHAHWLVLKHRGLDATSYELVHAVLVALKNPDLEISWLDGERVFAGIAEDHSEDPTFAEGARIDELWSETIWDVAHGDPPPDSVFSQKLPKWCL